VFVLADYTPMAPMLVREPFHRDGWVYEEKVDGWRIGRVAAGMHRQGYDLQLTQYDERGWRATFYSTAMEHSLTTATGTGWERTPWHATQRAAWEVLKKKPRAGGRIESGRRRGATRIVGACCEVDWSKAGYRAYGVRIEVAGKEKGDGLMESSFYLDIVKRGNPPKK